MRIAVRGASEHNLRGVDADFRDGLTVITGVSGSGKTSLAFDTLYHESRRRFLDVFGRADARLSPARVASLTGAGPATAVGQNLLNRNPSSTLATASGLHPLLRLAFARFSERFCAGCGAAVNVLTEDEIAYAVSRVPGTLRGPIVRRSVGSHRTLIAFLRKSFPGASILVDGRRGTPKALDPAAPHDIDVELTGGASIRDLFGLGALAVTLRTRESETVYSRAPVCNRCGTRFAPLEPLHFHTACPYCRGRGCVKCGGTGLHPEAAATRFFGKSFPEVLQKSVAETRAFFRSIALPDSALRLKEEILRRLEALDTLGLGYVGLDRPVPTLSRGEAQRLRLSVSLAGRLEDILHVLDEPTIGLHPMDVLSMIPAFRSLGGPVVFIEHDRIAAALADRALDLGPGAGGAGGRLLLEGTPRALWKSGSPTGLHFSRRALPAVPARRPTPEEFFTVRGASLRNLRGIDVAVPLGRLAVVTGVSGSGKSTLVVDVIAASLQKRKPVGCSAFNGKRLVPVIVDQEPIGLTPRSNPATYTKLADLIRNRFSRDTGLSASCFSFNRPEGACDACAGIGAVEVRMRYLPSTWIPCSACGGRRFRDEVLSARACFGPRSLSISEVYEMSVAEAKESLKLDGAEGETARHVLEALCDIGLGYLGLGQPSPTLSGGEAQRVKLAKFLGRKKTAGSLIILDEPSTGLHPADIAGLLVVFDRLVRSGATLLVIEHNSDVIRAADWIMDLGPGAGPEGGRLLFAGPFGKLAGSRTSLTAKALREEAALVPAPASGTGTRKGAGDGRSSVVVVKGATANNLRNVTARFPKGRFTVVTGVSGSGKSSLVSDVLEAEAKKRFLETLSLYERQAVKEGPETQAESVRGLGVTLSISPSQSRLFNPRFDVGAATEISHHLAILFAFAGARRCPSCGRPLARGMTHWQCTRCGPQGELPEPRHFSPRTYAGACRACHGVGSFQAPEPEKLIVKPDKPLCAGAMYSPGFFPGGYLCKPFNGGYDIVQALARRHGFDTHSTPWNRIGRAAQEAFLHGEKDPLRVFFRSRAGRVHERELEYRGFYGWVRDWDLTGTYTDTKPCPECGGSRLRPEYSGITLSGRTVHEASSAPLSQLEGLLGKLSLPAEAHYAPSLSTTLRRISFLRGVGLGYLHLGRLTASLSAGEAQRVKLAGLLGSGLTSLTVILDEPTRGMHPSEVDSLTKALEELRDAGNTIVVVEHDLTLIRRADHIIEMGPGAGARGGTIVSRGAPQRISRGSSPTGRWLLDPGRAFRAAAAGRNPRTPERWLTVKDPRENNLRGGDVRFPLGLLCGVCGVSGSGKSTLVVDTLGRALAPAKHTTSIAQEPVKPGAHSAITGVPRRVIVIDQARAGLGSPLGFLGLDRIIRRLYARSAEARGRGYTDAFFRRTCTACRGSGSRWIDMGFLPDVSTPCETCGGTGYPREAHDIRVRGKSLPELVSLTIDEVSELWQDNESLARPLGICRDAGIGYLVLRQGALSGGEAQRLKMAAELVGRPREDTLVLMDEPTVGLHAEDVLRLVSFLHLMADGGRSIIAIEHNPILLAACDWLIELGPGGGPEGGQVIAEGAPPQIAKAGTPSSSYLRELLA